MAYHFRSQPDQYQVMKQIVASLWVCVNRFMAETSAEYNQTASTVIAQGNQINDICHYKSGQAWPYARL
jgi:hypothetical protein